MAKTGRQTAQKTWARVQLDEGSGLQDITNGTFTVLALTSQTIGFAVAGSVLTSEGNGDIKLRTQDQSHKISLAFGEFLDCKGISTSVEFVIVKA